MPSPFDAEATEVRAMRAAHSLGMDQCQKIIVRQNVSVAIEGIRNGNHNWKLVADILDNLNNR